MYKLLFPFFMLLLTPCNFYAYEDYYEPTQRPTRNENLRYNDGQRRNAEYVTHNHPYARTETAHYERLRNSNGQTTVKSSIELMANASNTFRPNDEHNGKNNSKRKSQAYEDDSKMLFPSDIPTLDNRIVSRNCSFGLCEEADGYPTETINRILRQSELKKFFSSEVHIANRFSDGDEGENLCVTITHTRFPKTAKNMQNKEQVIINVDQYKQGIVFETCKDEALPCNYAENFPNNFTPKCVQKYTVRKLMVVGKESDRAVFDDFSIPSCCVCMVKK